MTRLILLRHAEAEGNINRRFHGHFNSNLTENGKMQAQKVAERLSNEKIDVIYSSDLTRALETAETVAKYKGISVIKSENLREINGGDWEDTPWETLPVSYPESYYHWENMPHLLQMPNGEAMVHFQNRIVNEINSITRLNIEKNILIVTHGTAIKSFLCFCYNKSLSEFVNLKWHDNASITILAYENCIYKVVIEGDNSHLGNLSTLAKQDWWKNKKL